MFSDEGVELPVQSEETCDFWQTQNSAAAVGIGGVFEKGMFLITWSCFRVSGGWNFSILILFHYWGKIFATNFSERGEWKSSRRVHINVGNF